VEKWVFCLEIVPLAVLALRRIRRYNDLVQSNYADASQHSLVMVRLMFVLFLVTSVLSAFSNMLGRYRFLDDTSLLAFPSVVFSLLIFMQVYIGMRYNYPAIADDGADTGPQEGMLEKTAAAAPQVSDRNEKARQEAAERMRELRRRIEKLMDEEKIFLQNGLKISDLAEQLCCNRNYIYRAINVEMGISFAEYVNKKRVDYAKQMIEQKPDLQMNELYMRVGFSSSSSFYRRFRQFEGCTPKELQERLRKDKQQTSLTTTP
jgi:AraC-like DNA-binding protein